MLNLLRSPAAGEAALRVAVVTLWLAAGACLLQAILSLPYWLHRVHAAVAGVLYPAPVYGVFFYVLFIVFAPTVVGADNARRIQKRLNRILVSLFAWPAKVLAMTLSNLLLWAFSVGMAAFCRNEVALRIGDASAHFAERQVALLLRPAR